MPDQEITNQVNVLSPEYRNYVTSEMPSVIAQSLSEYHVFDQSKTMALENAILLLLIFKLNPDQFTQFIISECLVDEANALEIYNAVLLALPGDISMCFENTIGLLAGNAYLVQPPAPKYTESTYTTTQAAILQEGAMTPPPTPPSNTPATPRWDSE